MPVSSISFADVFGDFGGPGVVGTIELDHFVAHLGDGADRGQGVLGHLVANRIEFDADGYVLARGRGESKRSRRGGREEAPAGNGTVRCHAQDINTPQGYAP